jgi:AcrR family transcriptional regulator
MRQRIEPVDMKVRVTRRTELEPESLALELQSKRSEMMTMEIEAVALRLFEERGFKEVTVEEIAAAARISARTFYRYFPSKEDVLQVRIDRRSRTLRSALEVRPEDEPVMQSLRLALEEVLASEDMVVLRRWIAVVMTTPSVLMAVVGGIQLKSNRVMVEFFGSRLGLSDDDLVPLTLAAAAGGVIQTTFAYWFFNGGDLAATVSETFKVLEKGLCAEGPW